MLEVLPLSYNSSCIGFSTWISILTLCLTPLIAHIISGSGKVSYLSDSRPAWHNAFGHYNPTSIMWRYCAVADRRVRAKRWSPKDLAATNAIFWTSHGWDGSERMVNAAMRYCTLLPDGTMASVFSAETLQTLITTLQGIAALYILAELFAPNPKDTVTWTVDTAFYPLAEIGLLRTLAALWLTDDYSYVFRRDVSPKELPLSLDNKTVEKAIMPVKGSKETYERANLEIPIESFNVLDQDPSVDDRFRPVSYWASRLFRGFYLLLVIGLWLICLMCFVPLGSDDGPIFDTVTVLMITTFYLYMLSVSAAVCGYYIFQGSSSTIVPCISSYWYRAYTISLFLYGLATITLASVEINQVPGGYNASPLNWSGGTCMPMSGSTYVVDSTRSIFGIAVANVTGSPFKPKPYTETFNTSAGGSVWVYNFTGICMSTSGAYVDAFKHLLQGAKN